MSETSALRTLFSQTLDSGAHLRVSSDQAGRLSVCMSTDVERSITLTRDEVDSLADELSTWLAETDPSEPYFGLNQNPLHPNFRPGRR